LSDQGSTVFVGGASELDCQLLAASLARKGVRVIGSAFRAAEIIAGVSNLRPQAALISGRLEEGDFAGLAVVREISLEQPDLRSVVLVDSADPEVVVESYRCGAVGVFSRSNGSAELRMCIQKVLQGNPWVSDADVLCLIGEIRKRPRAPGANSNGGLPSGGTSLLTRREEQIVELLMTGMTNREMARQLGLSEHTIKNYFFSIFEKIGVSTRVELLLYAMTRRKAPHWTGASFRRVARLHDHEGLVSCRVRGLRVSLPAVAVPLQGE
jgi:DNA-binding NarL/FixJ family response regulator